jgi:hypothetical protein
MLKNFSKTFIPLNSITLKNNLQLVIKTLKYKTKKNTIFISNQVKSNDSNIIFFKALSSNKFLVLKKWPSGFITNFYQMCNSYKNALWYKFLLEIDLLELKFIFLDNVPEKNTNFYKELFLLKKTLNLKIISLIDIKQKNFDKNLIVDLPLYYDSSDNINTDSLIYFTLLKHLIK